ncbi:response regulator [Stieleria sp. JC731]|uniref:ATP-binding protein n=1 Tax=Pirellulaceae TaxID=2691357 RepID=UPI001E558495|nr:ATP-binding protein [Stieleria sp. JC731]MCC9600371.1 response regulator [Stieleria sp. JC731]
MSDAYPSEESTQRVAVFAPTQRDAELCGQILSRAEISYELCTDMPSLCAAIASGIGVGLAPEGQLTDAALIALEKVLREQPEWSDFPLLVLLGSTELSSERVDRLLSLGNVTLVPSPVRIAVFVSKLRARLRDRQRQVAVRNLLLERRQAAEAAEIDSRRLRMALQAGEMGIWEWSPQELYWSPRFYELFGFDPSVSPDPNRCFERVHEEDRDELIDLWQRSLNEAIDLDMEFRIHHPTLGLRWLSAAGEPVSNEPGTKDGRVVRHAGVLWDVTQRHETEASLREARELAESANRSKSEFLANMSHEIRTPMTAILGYVDLLRENTTGGETDDYIETIRRNGFYLLDIINDILDLSKIEADRVDLVPEPFSPLQLVEDVRSIMSVRAEENGIGFAVECNEAIPETIIADQKRLKQILINLVGNAIKFTDKGTVTLAVHYQTSTNHLNFQVTDTGIGMTERQMRRLFRPFTQVDASDSRRHEGTGLGLVISQRLAKMMGGDITVESESGVGSCFTASIDAGEVSNRKFVSADQIESEPEREPNRDDTPLDCSVLVVDDRRDIRFLASRLLSKAGAQISEADDGQEAVEIVQEMIRNDRLVDLILLDMQMPRLDGYRTTEQLRRLGFEGPIVALTADAMKDDMVRCLECGCNDYLSKPIDKTALVSCVRRLTTPKSKSLPEST